MSPYYGGIAPYQRRVLSVGMKMHGQAGRIGALAAAGASPAPGGPAGIIGSARSSLASVRSNPGVGASARSNHSSTNSPLGASPEVQTRMLRFAPPIVQSAQPYTLPELRVVDEEMETKVLVAVGAPALRLPFPLAQHQQQQQPSLLGVGKVAAAMDGGSKSRCLAFHRADTCLLVTPRSSPFVNFAGVLTANDNARGHAASAEPLSLRRYDADRQAAKRKAMKQGIAPEPSETFAMTPTGSVDRNGAEGGEMGERGNDMAHYHPADKAARKSFIGHQSQLVSDSIQSLDDFDLTVDEKRAFQEFLDEKRGKVVPAVILGAFRHDMCIHTPLCQKIKQLSLSTIEGVVRQFAAVSTLTSVAFSNLVKTLLPVGTEFTESDLLNLFDYFDSTGQGEVAFRDLCNGFVLILSADGPKLPIMHRCMTLVYPKVVRDTRLTMMTRLELIHIAAVIQDVFDEILDSAVHATADLRHSILLEKIPPTRVCSENTQLAAQESDVKQLHRVNAALKDALKNLMLQFACNMKGSLAYNEARQAMQRNKPIRTVVSLMKVPREKKLYDSFLSEFFRTTDAIDRPQRLPKQVSLLQKHFLKRSLADGLAGSLSPSLVAIRVNEHDQEVEDEDDDLSLAMSLGRVTNTRSVVLRKNPSRKRLGAGDPKGAAGAGGPGGPGGPLHGGALPGRDAVEHDNPRYFTRHGVLFLLKSAAGEAPAIPTSAAATAAPACSPASQQIPDSAQTSALPSPSSKRKSVVGLPPLELSKGPTATATATPSSNAVDLGASAYHVVSIRSPRGVEQLLIRDETNALPVRTTEGEIVRGRYYVEDRRRLSSILAGRDDADE